MSRGKVGFSITCGRGFQITFSNGVTISVQFGPNNYCDNREYGPGIKEASFGAEGCKNAEIAFWDINNNWITREFSRDVLKQQPWDDVLANVTPDEVAQAIAWASSLDTTTLIRWKKPAEVE